MNFFFYQNKILIRLFLFFKGLAKKITIIYNNIALTLFTRRECLVYLVSGFSSYFRMPIQTIQKFKKIFFLIFSVL